MGKVHMKNRLEKHQAFFCPYIENNFFSNRITSRKLSFLRLVMKKRFIAILSLSALLLTGCNFFFGGDSSTGDVSSSSQAQDEISSFEFVTDASLTKKTDTDSPYYLLTMYVGDTYQIRTNIDNKLANKYHFVYEEVDEEKYIVSSSGLVTASATGAESFRVKLLRNSDSKKIYSENIIINIKEPTKEYADITIDDATLDYDNTTRTYSVSLKGGSNYRINTSIHYNVAYSKSFELSSSDYASFMSVSASGFVVTERVTEDKDGQVTIQTKSTDGTKVYDTVYLNVHVRKSDDVIEKDLVVTDLSSGTKLSEGDSIKLYVGESMSFDIKYGIVSQTSVMSVSNSNVLDLDNEKNKITALSEGSSNVTFTCEDKSLTIEIQVIKNALSEIYANNGGNDFIIVNGKLSFLGRIFAKYASGLEIDITNSENLKYVVSDKNDSYKSVTLTYTENGVNKSVTYDVRFFVTEQYAANTTAYNFSDYYDNAYRNKCYVLPKEGRVHMLVIPVWFTNSNTFFKENQKDEILGDLEYVYCSTRTKENCYSVKQFYEQESNGKLTLDITISEFYESGTSSKVYGDTVEEDVKRTHSLADTAIQWYFNNHAEESISDYDGNGDGLVDAVSLCYAANYYGTIGDSNGTTAFQFKNTQGSTHKYNNGSFSPIGGIYGFNKTSSQTGLNVQDLSTFYPSYYFNSGGKTIIHETGHMFGIEDLYEDNHAEVKYYPAGRFSMQSSNFGGHDPYQMNLVGWSQPQIFSATDYNVGDTITIKLDDFATSGNNILLTNEWNAYNSLFDEYMLLELLAPTGLNYFEATNAATVKFSDAGIRLWHVNSVLENLSDGGKKTSEISNSNWVNLKYSNNNQSSEYDLAHWIRNNVEEPYDTVSTVRGSYGLFKTGDRFDMDSYQSQFVHAGKLDNQEKLGWEFNVDSVYQTVDDTYGAVITLTRVDNTRTDFEFSSRLDKDIAVQPTEDGNDYAQALLGDDELFSLVYNFNDATAPSYYTQGKPISYRGLCLFAEPNGNGGSLVITIKDKDGYRVVINSLSVTHTMLTKASLTAIVDGQVVTGTSFAGPFNQHDGYNEKGLTYEVNSNSITLQNKYTDGTDYWSVIALYSVSISYHIEII